MTNIIKWFYPTFCWHEWVANNSHWKSIQQFYCTKCGKFKPEKK